MPKQTELPELPENIGFINTKRGTEKTYTANQMREYALAAIKAQSLQAVSDLGQLQSALEENERLRKELAAVKGEGEAVAWLESKNISVEVGHEA